MAIPGYYDEEGTLTDTSAWVALGSATVPASTALVTFSSTTGVNNWSQYMDLFLISYAKGGAGAIKLHINEDDDDNYYTQSHYTDGSSAAGQSAADRSYMYNAWIKPSGGLTFSGCIAEFYDINSGKWKTVHRLVADDHNGSGYLATEVDTWQSQAPIIRLDLTDYNAGDIGEGSRFDLFGILPRLVAV